MSSEQSIDTLIGSLTEDLGPVCRLMHPVLRILPWALVALLYTALTAHFIGIRPDLGAKMTDNVFLFEVGLMAAVSLFSALASTWLCVPDMRGQKWLVGIPFSLFGVFSFWVVVRSVTEAVRIPSMHWDHCMGDAALMVLLPMLALIFLSRRGATTKPNVMCAANALSIGALGYVGLRFTCIMDTVGHTALYHVLPFIAFGLFLSVFARRIYRW